MRMKKMLGAVALMGMMASAQAGSLSLVYVSGGFNHDDGVIDVGGGQVITVDLFMDFSDEATLGGGFDINWDPNLIASANWISADLGDDMLRRDPTLEPLRLYDGGFADFDGLSGPALVGTIEFTIIGNPAAGLYNVTPSGTDGLAGPFVSAVDNVSLLNPDYEGVVMRVVPLPAAVWFLISGLGALLGLSRRRVG